MPALSTGAQFALDNAQTCRNNIITHRARIATMVPMINQYTEEVKVSQASIPNLQVNLQYWMDLATYRMCLDMGVNPPFPEPQDPNQLPPAPPPTMPMPIGI